LVLLSVRDLDEWYDSAAATIFPASADDPSRTDEQRARRRMWIEILRSRFVEDLDDRERVIAAARAHNEAVIASIASDRLLVWSPGDGWEPICTALGLPVPDAPFPRTNTRQEFVDRRGDHSQA
jgi:hypothetical protein